MNWQYVKANKLHCVFGILIACCAFYERINYVGLYRVIAQWQLDLFGRYYANASMLPSMIVYAGVTYGLAKLICKVFPSLQLNVEVQENKPIETYAEKKVRQAKIVGAIGIALFIIGSCGAYIGSHYFRASPLTNFVMGVDIVPKSSYINVQGIAQESYIIEYSDRREKYIITPVTSPDWKKGQSITYFIRTQYPTRSKAYPAIKQEEGSNKISFTGYVVKDGLEGMVKETYKKNNISLTNPHYVIDYKQPLDIVSWPNFWRFAAPLLVLSFAGTILILVIQAKWSQRKTV